MKFFKFIEYFSVVKKVLTIFRGNVSGGFELLKSELLVTTHLLSVLARLKECYKLLSL